MATHRLDAAPDTVHWGYFDAKLKPRLAQRTSQAPVQPPQALRPPLTPCAYARFDSTQSR